MNLFQGSCRSGNLNQTNLLGIFFAIQYKIFQIWIQISQERKLSQFHLLQAYYISHQQSLWDVSHLLHSLILQSMLLLLLYKVSAELVNSCPCSILSLVQSNFQIANCSLLTLWSSHTETIIVLYGVY